MLNEVLGDMSAPPCSTPPDEPRNSTQNKIKGSKHNEGSKYSRKCLVIEKCIVKLRKSKISAASDENVVYEKYQHACETRSGYATTVMRARKPTSPPYDHNSWGLKKILGNTAKQLEDFR